MNALSEEEMRELQSQVEGIDPEGLAKVIYDSINRVGKHVRGEFGVHFTQLEEEAVGAVPIASCWQDDSPPQQMSRKSFLSILEFVAEQILHECESDNGDLSPGVNQLEEALEALKKEISALPSMTYHDRSDSGFTESVDSGFLILQDPPTPLTDVWDSDDPDEVFIETPTPTQQGEEQHPTYRNEQNRRHSSSRIRGIEEVMERLPELRFRYGEGVRTSKRALRRVRERFRAVNILRKPGMSPLVEEGASAPMLQQNRFE